MKQPDNFMKELHRLLEKQDFNSEEEVQEFMNGIMKNGMPSFPPEELSDKEKAQEMVFAAYEQTPDKAKEYTEAALLLDPNCIEAYEYLGDIEDSVPVSMVFYEKAIAIGREVFGGDYLEKHKGMFWGFYETRPFMRCLHHQAECLHIIGKIEESIAILEEMIELNPNDNQGVRDQLLLFLAQLGETKKFQKYDKMFEDDSLSSAYFTRALFAFKTEGETQRANKLLSQAIKQNKFIAKRLLSSKQITTLPDSYTRGSKEEADCYVDFAKPAWKEAEGALDWLTRRTAGSSKK
jgi:tetratricopeptide (TPR) repeat protein